MLLLLQEVREDLVHQMMMDLLDTHKLQDIPNILPYPDMGPLEVAVLVVVAMEVAVPVVVAMEVADMVVVGSEMVSLRTMAI
jgi:hypothetical protein